MRRDKPVRSPVTAARRKQVDAYIRVSRVGKRRGPSFISPSVQRDAIEAWTARSDTELLEVFEELDESGGRADRPLLELAVRRIEIGGSDGLVVWRVDRFGRSLAHGVQTIERIRRAGGGFWSVQDGLDISTDAGRLVLRILLSVAEYQLDGVRAGWHVARERAIRRGAYTNNWTPVGYRKTRASRLRPHPTTAPLITELFRRRAACDGLMVLGRWLESQGIRTAKGNPGWSASALSHMMRSRIYLGEIRSGPYINANAHPPLTEPATWQAAQNPRIQRRYEHHDALLTSGLARCAACRHSLQPFVLRAAGRPVRHGYGCRRFSAAGPCPAPAVITAAKLEAYVVEQAFRILGRRRRPPRVLLAEAQTHAEMSARSLARYRDGRAAEVIDQELFLAGLAVRHQRHREALLQLARAQLNVDLYDLPPVPELRAAWPTMTVFERRRLIARVIDGAFVTVGHAPAQDRVRVYRAGTGPGNLPRQGQRKAPRPREVHVAPRSR